jgi:DNA-binding response OmpR family regulator
MAKSKVLLVDDEENFAVLMKMRLEHDGDYDVKVLTTAKNVIEVVHEFVPDVILLDLLMPGLGGLEACEMLDKDKTGAGIPVIVLSALGSDSDKLKAYKLGVVGYFVKPVKADELIRVIGKAIRGKREGIGD